MYCVDFAENALFASFGIICSVVPQTVAKIATGDCLVTLIAKLAKVGGV
jgi:hypothetical protein